ncbi:MAG: 50S ribosomal protein L10 [Deltaproteobacteria bacterium]|nr:50S ribosomal protein L10 [Candidatus Anaeroferrophillacea bacterium]
MDRSEKQAMVEYLASRFAKAQAAFLTDYRGLDVEALSALRDKLEEQGAEFRVVKNTLARIAARDTIVEVCIEQLNGPNAVALVYEDPAAAAKVLKDFAKGKEQLEIKGGALGDTLLTAADIEQLASLPGKDVLRAQLLGALNAVPGGMVNVLAGVLRSFVQVLGAIRDEREA